VDVEPVFSTAGVNLDAQAEARDITFDAGARRAVVLRNRFLVGLSFSAGVIT
jgi:hypothetical protein